MMHTGLLIAVPFAPMLLAFVAGLARYRAVLLLPPLLALLAAMVLPTGFSIHLPWMLQGIHLQLDETAGLFLLFSAVIWLIAGLSVTTATSGVEASGQFRVFFLLAFSGNMLLIVAADMISFYLGFAMMGLSAYGLIIAHSQRARRAARVYLAFTLVGELALFCAILFLYSSTGSLLFSDLVGHPLPGLAVALLLLGFGIKLALPGLHPWLPLVYSTAPIVTAAVLSGPMMKAGLLGWIRFLPTGSNHLVGWGEPLMWLGLAGVLCGSVLALLQRLPRAVLAYSSIAKMGLISYLFGYALAHPSQAPLLMTALVLFAMHHLLVKSALFLGLAQQQQKPSSWVIFAGLVVLSMSLIGLPWSGGSAAKLALLNVDANELDTVLKLSGFAGAIMMVHFLSLLRPATYSAARTGLGNVALTGWLLLLPLAWWGPWLPASIALDMNGLWFTFAAIALVVAAKKAFVRPRQMAAVWQPGDIYHLCTRLRLRSPFCFRAQPWRPLAAILPGLAQQARNRKVETTSLAVPGFLWLGVFVLLSGLILFP